MRASSTRTDNRRERGANLVEFALVLPLLVLMLAGIADLGQAFSAYIRVTNAAREAARIGVRNSAATEDMEIAAARELGLRRPEDDEALEIFIEKVTGDDGRERIVVTVEYYFPLILGGLLNLPGGAITLRNEARMPVFETE